MCCRQTCPLLFKRLDLASGRVAFSLGACDLTSSDRTTKSKEPVVDPDSAALSYSHMPTGTSLPDPGEIPLEQKIIGPGEDRTLGVKKSSRSEPSPYGCYLASRPYTDTVRFRSIYLRFPKAIVKSAGTATQRVVYRVLRTEGRTREGEGIRFAHCTIPETEAAYSLALQQVLRVDGGSAHGRQAEAKRSAKTKSKDCHLREAIVCVRGDCEVKDRWWDCSGSTGSGEGPIGSDPPDGEPEPYPGDDGGGGGEDEGGSGGVDCTEKLPTPGSDCVPEESNPEVNETRLCRSDPLKDMDIRPTCSGVEGGRFGENARGQGNPHYGIDLLADIGTEVHSMREGIVWARNESEDFGKYIIIQTDGGNLIIYAHLSKRTVEGGESLSTGELIGKTGVSGNACETDCSCGPAHLHLGVKEGNSWAGGTPKDPENYIGAEFDSDGEAISDNCSPVFKGG